MTNSSLSSALKVAGSCLLALAIAGCGDDGGADAFADACEAYRAHDLKKADKLLAASLAKAGDDADRLVAAVRVKLDLGEIAAAKELAAKAESVAGDDSDVRLLSAQVAFHGKDVARARQLFRGVADEAKFEAKVRAQGWEGLGVCEMSANERDFARVAFLRALLLDRRNAAARYHLALLYRDGFGFREAALEQFEVYVRLEPTASVRVQRVQRATIPDLKKEIARAAAERPGAANRDAAASAAALARAEAAWKKGNHKAARADYEKAFKADPLSYPAAIGLARAWEKTDPSAAGQRKALDCYQAACALRSGAIATHVAAGAFALRLGQLATAEALYSRAVAADANNVEALDGLIRTLTRAGGKSKVARAYQDYRDALTASRRRAN